MILTRLFTETKEIYFFVHKKEVRWEGEICHKNSTEMVVEEVEREIAIHKTN